jgi:uncharacterized repeat protein (TIGR01451 family)
MPLSSAPRAGRAAACAAGAAAMLLAAAAPSLAAEPATLRLLGSSPIYSKAIDVHTATGGDVRVQPATYRYRIAQAGTTTSEASGNCVDLSHYIVTGRDYDVTLDSAADAPELGSPEMLAAGWLLSQADRLIAVAPDAGFEAGALQVAVWQLSGQARTGDAPTSDAAINARSAALRQMAAGRRVPSDLAVSAAPGDTCLHTDSPITITGTPGAVVELTTGSEDATVSPAEVTIDGSGVATAELRSDAPGTAVVSAEMSAPALLRATKLAGQSAPQDQLFLRPGTMSASAAHAFVACGVVGFGVPTILAPAPAPAPSVAPVQSPPAAALSVSLDAPALAAPGGTAVYRLRVTNTGTTTRRDVRVAQTLDRRVTVIRAAGPRGSSARASRHAAHWRLFALRPGRSTTLFLKVTVGRRLAGDVAHTSAAVRGGRARGADTAVTAVVRRVGKTEQGF